MLGICRHPLQPVSQKLAEGTHILIAGSQYAYSDSLGIQISFFISRPYGSFRKLDREYGAGSNCRQLHFLTQLQSLADPINKNFTVEVGIGDGGK
ncbi:hypothetical protein D3C75_835500 [compost metagenome]